MRDLNPRLSESPIRCSTIELITLHFRRTYCDAMEGTDGINRSGMSYASGWLHRNSIHGTRAWICTTIFWVKARRLERLDDSGNLLVPTAGFEPALDWV